MHPDVFSTVALVFETAGLVAFAVSGALVAAERRMDIIGMVCLAVVTGTGGGMLRDVLMGATPVAALENWWMLLVAGGSGVIVFFLYRLVKRLHKAMLVFDAIGLGIFVVNGTLKAGLLGMNPVAAATVGLLTGVGGGIMRDVLAGNIPLVFQRGTTLYLTPALIAASLTATLFQLGWAQWWATLGITLLVVAVRFGSEFWGWHAPSLRTQVLSVISQPVGEDSGESDPRRGAGKGSSDRVDDEKNKRRAKRRRRQR